MGAQCAQFGVGAVAARLGAWQLRLTGEGEGEGVDEDECSGEGEGESFAWWYGRHWARWSSRSRKRNVFPHGQSEMGRWVQVFWWFRIECRSTFSPHPNWQWESM